MRSVPRRRFVLTFALLVLTALTAAAAASAEVVTRTDGQGRTITFDVLDATADVDWYAGVLANAAHGNEISRVTIRIVPRQEIRSYCGGGASACWSMRRGNSTITVPAGRDDFAASVLLHEYGHHLDSNWPVSDVEELNGTPAWWAARGMARLLAQGRVAFDYSLGWEQSIGEIFAEDYAYLHLPYDYGIPWLSPPDETLRAALFAELGAPAGPAPQPQPQPEPEVQPEQPKPPLVVTRAGRLAAGARRVIPFELLGPGRRVTVTATVYGVSGTTRVKLSVVCKGARVASVAVTGGSRTTIDRKGLGPARCATSLANGGAVARRYVIVLRLAIEPAA